MNQIPQNAAQKQDIIDEILKDIPSQTEIEVELPSEARGYKLPDPGRPITVRPMTFEDEKSMILGSKDSDPINIILQRCVSNIVVSELYPMDKMFLLLKLREISYGDDYQVLLICPKCQGENEVTIKLSTLSVNYVPDDFDGVETIKLPGIKREAQVRFPRVKDERHLDDIESLESNLWRFVVSIGGSKDAAVIAAVIKKLPLVDLKLILKTMKTQYGVERKVKLDCRHCKAVSVVDLPLNENFFEVNSEM